MPSWPLDRNAEKVAFYGDPFRAGFERDNIVSITPPWRMRYTDDNGRVTPIREIRIHRLCAASLQRVLNNLWEHYGRDQHNIEAVGLADYAGAYVKRNVRGSSSAISCHAFGAAIDLDPKHNPMNTSGNRGSFPDAVINIFKQEGWYWGGDFKSRKDPMHFQAAHEGTPVVAGPIDGPVPPEPTDEPDGANLGSVAAVEGPKPLWKSNLVRAGAGVGVGALGDAGYQATDVLNTAVNVKYSLTNLGVIELVSKHTSFFLMLIIAGLAGYIIWKKWHDNKGAKNV